jgi:hypothetical protein
MTNHNPTLSSRIAVVFVAVAIGALAVGCGPSPSDVCQKTFDLVKAESGEAAANDAIGGNMASCVDKESLRKDMQGMFKYGDNNKCLMSAKTLQEASACAK